MKITAVAEVIKDSSKNLPRALIESVALVTVLYIFKLLVIGGMFTQDTNGAESDLLTAAARRMLGNPGIILIVLAGLLAKTTFDAVSQAAYNIFNGLIDETEKRMGDMILMGWDGGFSIGRIYNSLVQKIIENIKAFVGILKDHGLDEINTIMIPWGGG